jgi:hypothetical protein
MMNVGSAAWQPQDFSRCHRLRLSDRPFSPRRDIRAKADQRGVHGATVLTRAPQFEVPVFAKAIQKVKSVENRGPQNLRTK